MMNINDLIELLREDGLNCVAGEMSTGELQYLAADAISILRAENTKLRKVVEAAEKLLSVFCNGYSCSVSEPRTLQKCEQWCNTKEKYLLKQALEELESK